MDATLWALVAPYILVGAPTFTPQAGVAPTGDEQYTYVAAAECRQGHGWLMKSDRDGGNMRRHGYYVLAPYGVAPNGTAPHLARMLCRPFL